MSSKKSSCATVKQPYYDEGVEDDDDVPSSSSMYDSPKGGEEDWSSTNDDDDDEEENTFDLPAEEEEDDDMDFDQQDDDLSPARGDVLVTQPPKSQQKSRQTPPPSASVNSKKQKRKKKNAPTTEGISTSTPSTDGIGSSIVKEKAKRRKVSLSPVAKNAHNKSTATTRIVHAQDVIELDGDDSSVEEPKKPQPPKSSRKKEVNAEETKNAGSAKKNKLEMKQKVFATPTPDKKGVKVKESKKSAEETSKSTSNKATKKTDEKSEKKKKKKRSFTDKLLDHMFLSCRPHTVKELAKFMDCNESSIEFTMLSLLDKQWVVKKEFTSKGGRTKELYWANQSCKSHELKDILSFASDEEIKRAKAELEAIKTEEASLARAISQLTKGPTNEQLEESLRALEDEVKGLNESVSSSRLRIDAARRDKGSSQKKGVYQNSQKRLKQKFNSMRDEWKKRRDKCMDFIDMLADGMEKKPKEVLKMLELETDEKEGVKLPAKYVIEK
jgi:predicted transcriptional regulator